MDYICEVCKDKKIIYKKDPDTNKPYVEKCKACSGTIKKHVLNKKLKKAHIPTSLWEYEFLDYFGKDKYNSILEINKYIKNFNLILYKNINLYLYGQQSCQKTTLMCIIGKELIKKGINVKFILAGDLISLLMKDSGYNSDRELADRINIFKKIELLLLDDIFDIEKSLYWSNSSNLVKIEWDRFLRYREAYQLRTIVTSNYAMSNINVKFGKSIQSLFNRSYKELKFFDSVEEEAQEKINKIFDEV